VPTPEKRRRRWILRGLGFAVLLFFVFILGSINVPFLQPDEPAEVILLYVFSTLVFLAFIIYGLVLTRYLARLYAEHRAQVLGTKFKTKMVVGALALSLLPVVALFFLSYALVNRTLDKWFPRPLEIVRDDALFIVRQMLEQHEDRARDLARAVAEDADLRRQLAARDVAGLQENLARLARRRKLHWVAVVDAAGQPVAVYRQPAAAGRAEARASMPSASAPSRAGKPTSRTARATSPPSRPLRAMTAMVAAPATTSAKARNAHSQAQVTRSERSLTAAARTAYRRQPPGPAPRSR